MSSKIVQAALVCAILSGTLLSDSLSERLFAYTYTPTTNPETVSVNVSLNSGNNSFTIPTGYLSTFTGVISNASASTPGILLKTGGGTLVLSGANTYTGGTLLQGGTIRLDNNAALGVWPASAADGNANGRVTVSGTGTIQTTANRTISNRFVTADAASTLTFNLASGTTLTLQNVNNSGTNLNSYGGVLATATLGSTPIFSGGGNLVVQGNSSSFGGGISSTGGTGVIGFDLTELAAARFLNNRAFAGNGGAVYVTATGTNTASLNFGDNVTISGNTATTTGTAGDGGGVFAYSIGGTLVEFGNHATVSGNTANRYGGGIYAFASQTGAAANLVLGTNTLFDSNVSKAPAAAQAGGGAIYSTHNAALSGNTLFRNNLAMSYGGAILMKGREAGTLLLDTAAGDIGFTGNYMNVTNIASPTTGTANSVYLDTLATMRFQGTGNVFFDDPIASNNKAGNRMILGRTTSSDPAGNAFSGFVQLRGNSIVQNNFTVQVGEGTLRLASGAQLSGATAGAFTLGTNGTLAGTGTLGFGTNTISGTVAADNAVFIRSDWSDATNSFTAGTGKTTIAATETVGTLTFTGATKFDGAEILVDIAGTNYDRIVVNNAVSFGTTKNNVISIADAAIGGTYNIITSTTAAVGGNPSLYFSVSGNISGYTGFGRYGAKVQYGTANSIANSVVQVVIGSEAGNTTLYWTGVTDDRWVSDTSNAGPQNWTDMPGGTPSETRFLNGDRVIFDTDHTVGPFDVNIPTPVTVADMLVTGSGDYTITGNISAQKTGTTLTDATGKLVKSGPGTLSLNGTNNFSGGIDITGGTVKAETAGSVDGGTVTMTNDSTLQFDNNVDGTFASNITGTGNLVKSDTGTLTLTGSNDYTGPTNVTAGTLVGSISSGTDLTVSSEATYQSNNSDRIVSSLNGNGTVDMQGKNLTVGVENTATGSGDFSGGVLTGVKDFTKTGSGQFIIGTKNAVYSPDGMIQIGGDLSLEQGSLEIDRTPDDDIDTTKVNVAGTATFAAGTTLHIGRELALTAQNVVVDAGAILDVCTCTGTGITLIESDNVIANDFHYTIGGTEINNNITLDVFVDGVSIYKTVDQKSIVIDAGELVWNNTPLKSAHGTFNIGTSFQISQVLADKPDDGRFYEEPAGTKAWDGKTLTKTGKGTLILSAANTYTGGTNIDAGTLVARNASALGNGTASVESGASLVLDFNGTLANALSGTGSLTIANSEGTPTNAVTIDKVNTGFSGATTINNGATLNMNNVSALGGSAITNSGILNLNAFNGETFANSLSGTGRLNVNDDTVISRDNAGFSGSTAISSGNTLTMGHVGALGSSTIDNTGTLNLDFNGTFANAFSGNGNLIIDNNVTINRGNMAFQGNTSITSGSTLTLNHFAGIGNSATQTVTNAGSFVFDLPGSGTNYFVQKITGSGTLTKNGAGTLILDNANTDDGNFYSGSTTVNAGTLITDLATNTAVPTCGTDLIVAAGATYRARTRDQWVRNLTGAGTVDMNAYDASGPKNLTICGGDFSGGTITGADTLTKAGSDDGTVLTVGTVSAVNLDHAIGILNIASGKTVTLSGSADFADGTILNIGPNTALTAHNGNVTIDTDTTLNVTGYNSSMGKIVLIDAGSNIATDFGTYTVNGADQRGSVSIHNYVNTSPIVQRNKDDMTQIVISTGGLVWNNTAPGTAHGTFEVNGSATVEDDLVDNGYVIDGIEGWDGQTLTKTGGGTLTLTGNNTYTGDTIVDGGKVTGTSGNAFGTGEIKLGDGTSVEYNVTNDGTTTNDISGTGSFVKSGGGTLVQTGENSYTGGTTVDGGVLVSNLPPASVDPPCGTPLVVAADATYQTYNTDVSISKLTGAGTVNMSAYDPNNPGNKNLTVCSGDFSDGNLLNVATLTKKNADTSFTIGTATVGNLNLAEGTLIIDTTEKLTVNGATTIANDTMLSIAALPALETGSLSIGSGVILDICGCSANGVVIVSQTEIVGDFADYYVGGVKIEDDMSLDKFINGLVVVREDSSNNPTSPGTQIRVTNGGLVWNNLEPNSSHGTFNISTTFKIVQELSDRNDLDGFQPFTDPGTGQTWDGKTLTKKGDGILTLANGSNSYTGGTDIEAGKVVVEVAGSLGSGEVRNSGILEYDLTGDGTMANNVSGTGSFVKNGTGILTATGTNTYTGGTTVNSGTLVSDLTAPTTAFPCGTALEVAAGAVYSPYGADQFVSNLQGAGTVDMNSYNLTVCSGDFSGGVITDVGTLTKQNVNGILTVGNVDATTLNLAEGVLIIAAGKQVTVAGAANIAAGTRLEIGANLALKAGGTVAIGSGTTLNVTGYNASMGKIVLIEAGSPIANDFNTYILNGTDQSTVISEDHYRNTSALIQRNRDDMSQIIVSTGGLVWNNTAPGTAHGTFDVTTDDTITENLQDNTVDTAWTFGWDGKTLTKTGTGNLTLTGNNTYTGGTVIEQGAIMAKNENSLGTGTVDIQTDGKLALDFDGTLTNTVQGAGQLEIDGNLNVAKSNSGFSGNTSIKNGTTTLQRADGLGSSAITLGDGTTLYFNTASDGTSNNEISGTGNLVKNGAGTLTLENDNQYTGDTTIRGGMLVANLTEADPTTLPCGTALTVNANTTFQAKSREQQISVLSGAGTVDMNGFDLTVCSGDFTGGTFANLHNVTKKSPDTLRTDGFDAVDFTLQEGTFILNSGQVVTLGGTANIRGGTILDVGAHLAFDVAGDVTIDPTATLNITGYAGSGPVRLIHSDTEIIGDFGTYTINGTRVVEQQPSLDHYYVVAGIEKIGNDEIWITDSYLAWNGELDNSAHGTFKIDSGTVTISDLLVDKPDDGRFYQDPIGTDQWDGKTLTKTGDGTLVLGNENTYSGDTIINGGSVIATGENSLGSANGVVRLTDNDVNLVLDYSKNGNFSKKVINDGTIRKIDGNTLTVVSDLTEMSGVFRQDDGTVIFTPAGNNFAGSYDQRGGVFEGVDGLTMAGDANFEAIVRPNGTLNVGGNVTLDGADYYVNLYLNEKSPQPTADRINGDQMIYIDGSTLHVNDKGVVSSYLDGGSVQFVVLHSTDGISGDFAAVTGITSLFHETHGIDGNDYVIELTLKKDPFDPHAPNHNTQEVVDTIHDGMDDPDLGPLVDDLINMDTDDEIAVAIDTLRGTEIAADGLTMALWSPWRPVFNRLYDDERSKTVADPCRPADCGRNNVRNAWFEGYYRDENISGDGNARGYDGRRGGMIVGLDTQLNRRITVGAMFGYGEPKISSRFGKIEADDYTMALYGTVRLSSKWRANAFLGYGRQEFDYRRHDFAGSYRAKYDGDALYTSLELVRPITLTKSRDLRSRVTLLPVFGVDFQKSWTDAFSERGTGYLQTIRKADLGQTVLRVGLNGLFRRGERFDLNTRLQYLRQVGGNTHGTVDASFAMAPNSRVMHLYGVNRGRDALNAGLGGNLWLDPAKRSSVFVDYDFDCAEHYRAHTGQIGFTTRW